MSAEDYFAADGYDISLEEEFEIQAGEDRMAGLGWQKRNVDMTACANGFGIVHNARVVASGNNWRAVVVKAKELAKKYGFVDVIRR